MPAPDDMLRAIREARDAQLRRINADYPNAANQITALYNDSVVRMENDIRIWADSLNPLWPGVQTDGDRLVTDNLLNRINSELSSLATDSGRILHELQEKGIIQGYIGGLQTLNAGGVAVGFNQTVLDTIISAIDYVNDPAMQVKLRAFGGHYAQQIADLIVQSAAQGMHPRQLARLLADYFKKSNRPLTDALRWARTTQIYAYRRGTQAVYRRSGVTQWIWSANLGSPRTCLACIAMHGTVHPVEQVLNDHFNGRCAMVPVTPTWADLGFTGGGEPQYQTGVDWLREQDDAVIRQYMGPQLFDAYQRGMFNLSPDTLVGTYQHDVFGEMRVLNPNWQILGSNIFG